MLCGVSMLAAPGLGLQAAAAQTGTAPARPSNGEAKHQSSNMGPGSGNMGSGNNGVGTQGLLDGND